MKGEKGKLAWRFSGSMSRYIDTYMKKDKQIEVKAEERKVKLKSNAKFNKRKNIDVDKVVEELLKIIGKD